MKTACLIVPLTIALAVMLWDCYVTCWKNQSTPQPDTEPAGVSRREDTTP